MKKKIGNIHYKVFHAKNELDARQTEAYQEMANSFFSEMNVVASDYQNENDTGLILIYDGRMEIIGYLTWKIVGVPRSGYPAYALIEQAWIKHEYRGRGYFRRLLEILPDLGWSYGMYEIETVYADNRIVRPGSETEKCLFHSGFRLSDGMYVFEPSQPVIRYKTFGPEDLFGRYLTDYRNMFDRFVQQEKQRDPSVSEQNLKDSILVEAPEYSDTKGMTNRFNTVCLYGGTKAIGFLNWWYYEKSEGIFTIVSPNKSLICVVKIVTAIPLVNPTTIGYGIYLIIVPRRNSPKATRNTPAINVATVSPCNPYC